MPLCFICWTHHEMSNRDASGHLVGLAPVVGRAHWFAGALSAQSGRWLPGPDLPPSPVSLWACLAPLQRRTTAIPSRPRSRPGLCAAGTVSTPRQSGAIRGRIVMAISYELPDDPSSINWSSTDTVLYTRKSGANQLYLQEELAALEGGEQAVVLACRVAALHAVFFTFFPTGAHNGPLGRHFHRGVLVPDPVHRPTSSVWRSRGHLRPQCRARRSRPGHRLGAHRDPRQSDAAGVIAQVISVSVPSVTEKTKPRTLSL